MHRFLLTEAGIDLAARLRAHKARGGTSATFEPIAPGGLRSKEYPSECSSRGARLGQPARRPQIVAPGIDAHYRW